MGLGFGGVGVGALGFRGSSFRNRNVYVVVCTTLEIAVTMGIAVSGQGCPGHSFCDDGIMA